MCIPAVAAAALIAGATQAVSIIATNQAVKANNKAVQASNETRKKQIDQAATHEVNERLREMRREQGRILVAAGEAGLSLQSGGVENLLLDSVQQAKLSSDTSLANRESRKLASDAQAREQLQAKTTLLGAGLRIGLAAGGAAQGVKNKQSAADG